MVYIRSGDLGCGVGREWVEYQINQLRPGLQS